MIKFTGYYRRKSSVKGYNFQQIIRNLFFIIYMVFLPSSVFAQFAGGTGTSIDPYQIATAVQLDSLARRINNGDTAYNRKYYKLIDDIDLSVYDSTNIAFNNGKGWTPIGNASGTTVSYGKSFMGVFDGNNKTITGLFINNSSMGHAGLFGYTFDATIKNIGMIDVNIKATDYVGSIIGACDYTDITNCYAIGKISGSAYVGGIIGNSYKDNNVTNSYAICVVSGGGSYIGGIVGNNFEGCSVKNCYAIGSVSGSVASGVGGIVGYNDGTVNDCVALNSSVTRKIGTAAVGRVAGSSDKTLSNNIAFSKMLNTAGDTIWNMKGADMEDGADILVQEILIDGTLGGRFTSAEGWTTQNGKLPGLFGTAVDMPSYLLLPIITTNILPTGTVNISYNQSITATSATSITWELFNGNLPNGLTFDLNGIILGTPTEVGTFTFEVKVINSAGSDTKELSILIEDGVDIANISQKTALRIYPNPTNQQLRIVGIDEYSVVDYTIYNITGQLILHGKLRDSSTINVGHLAKGMYYLKISDIKLKFVKN
jgi:hypothetical protein